MLTFSRTLVPMRTGTGKPLFFVHGISATVAECWELVSAMRSPRPVLGFQARGLDGQEPAQNRVEDIAAAYVEQMRAVQPNGPYAVAGYSFGGLVALEMAHQLQRVGEPLEFLCLLDCYANERWLPLRPWLRCRYRFLAGQWRKLRAVPAAQLSAYLRDKLVGAVNRVRVRFGYVVRQPKGYRATLSPVLQHVQDTLWVAMVRYRPRPWHAGPIVYVRAAVVPEDATDPMPLWHRIARNGLTYVEVETSHAGMLEAPYAEVVAAVLDKGLKGVKEIKGLTRAG